MRLRAVVAALSCFVMIFGPSSVAHAGRSLPALVSHVPVAGTPTVNDSTSARETVAAYAETGAHAFYGGYVTSVNLPGRSATSCGHLVWQTYSRARRAGEALAPSSVSCPIRFNGPVEDLEVSPDRQHLFVAGKFTQVRVGSRVFNRTGLAKISIAGRTVTNDFRPSLTRGTGRADVMDLAFFRGHLFVAGNFTTVNGVARRALASLSPATGALTSYINLAISGQFAGGTTGVAKVVISPTGRRAAIVGEFTSVAGASRTRVAMILLQPVRATLSAWYSPRFAKPCATHTLEYVRDMDFNPTGTRITFGMAGGWNVPGKMCDGVARFVVTDRPNAVPVWQHDTVGDTIWSVEDTGAVVYAAGHEKGWSRLYQNDRLVKSVTQSVSGISALSGATGRLVPWEAGRDRGEGIREMVSLGASSYRPAGLMTGGDTFWWYRAGWRDTEDRGQRLAYRRGCIALLPHVGR